MTATPASTSTIGHPLVRTFVFTASWLAVLSSLYHITAIYLLPLPGELHPNMHLLFAFSILLIGGAASQPNVYGERMGELGLLALLYVFSLFPAVFLFYSIGELGEDWSEFSLWWVYALPFVLWAAMMVRERAWLALGLWLTSFLPAVLLWANWSSLSGKVQDPTSWWFLLTSAIPTAWVLFGIFYRSAEGVRRAGVPLIIMTAALAFSVWRVIHWAQQPEEVRDVLYLWPLLVLLVPIFWARRGIQEQFENFPSYPFPRSLVIGMNAALLLLAIGACLYIFYFYEDLSDRVGAPAFIDTRAGFVMIGMVIELTRRCFGPSLPILALITIVYGIWGNLFASPFGHGGASWIELIGKLTTDFIGGILGFLVVISSTFIIMFLILGAFLHESGAGRFFVNFSLGLFGRLRAGPGLAAVGASALMGTVSGSASGNVVTTGTFTIPLMKRTGLASHMAGAIEAAASTGGQIMPPVMGVGAFIMSELIEVPYIQLIGYAAIPAVLYFTIVGINLHFATGQLNIRPLPPEAIPDWQVELRNGWFYLVPLAFLVYFLMEGRTPVFAGVMSIFVMVGIWFYRVATPFVASLRKGERYISDEDYVFVPVVFFSFLVLVYILIVVTQTLFGLPLRLGDPPSWAHAVVSGALFALFGGFLGALLIRWVPLAEKIWKECQRGWLFIYPLIGVAFWVFWGWDTAVAGILLCLLTMGLISARRKAGFEEFVLVPWLFIFEWAVAFVVQSLLYTTLPAVSEFSEVVRPFGFLYHAVIFFGLATLIQAAILALQPEREGGDHSRLRPHEIVALTCNPFVYLARMRHRDRGEPDLAAAAGCADWVMSVRRALEIGGRQGAEFGVTVATIGLVVQVLTITGVGNKFALFIESLSQDVCLFGMAEGGVCVWDLGVDGFFVGLILTAASCAILGMGMPTTAAYVLLAILGAPALIKLTGPEMVAIHGAEWAKTFVAVKGDRVAAHLFIFYFAILSAITPPVAIASLVGAKVAEAPYFKTSMTALRFAIVGFVVPFLFMYQPALLALDIPSVVVMVTVITLLAFVAFSAAVQGHLLRNTDLADRTLLFACAIFLIAFVILFHWFALFAGAICAACAVVKQCRRAPASATADMK